MIIARLRGGLGNQMFQYALGRHLALKNGAPLLLDLTELESTKLRKYELGFFNIAAKTISDYQIGHFARWGRNLRLGLDSKRWAETKEQSKFFDPRVLELRGDVYLDGYWQSEKYFNGIRDTIREDFTFKTEPDPSNEKMLEQIRRSNSVCLHVRRGDYVADQITNRFHGTCGLDYYREAANSIKARVPDAQFFVFSDDLDWASANMNLDGRSTIVGVNGTDKGVDDMRLMSNCKHFIIANSSFSWWGAWLSKNPGKIVCAPKRWFREADEGDIIPESWVRIEGDA
ncbi:MAG: alpha-1,2-fucosyltransferase [Methanobacteriota archaeon]